MKNKKQLLFSILTIVLIGIIVFPIISASFDAAGFTDYIHLSLGDSKCANWYWFCAQHRQHPVPGERGAEYTIQYVYELTPNSITVTHYNEDTSSFEESITYTDIDIVNWFQGLSHIAYKAYQSGNIAHSIPAEDVYQKPMWKYLGTYAAANVPKENVGICEQETSNIRDDAPLLNEARAFSSNTSTYTGQYTNTFFQYTLGFTTDSDGSTVSIQPAMGFMFDGELPVRPSTSINFKKTNSLSGNSIGNVVFKITGGDNVSSITEGTGEDANEYRTASDGLTTSINVGTVNNTGEYKLILEEVSSSEGYSAIEGSTTLTVRYDTSSGQITGISAEQNSEYFSFGNSEDGVATVTVENNPIPSVDFSVQKADAEGIPIINDEDCTFEIEVSRVSEQAGEITTLNNEYLEEYRGTNGNGYVVQDGLKVTLNEYDELLKVNIKEKISPQGLALIEDDIWAVFKVTRTNNNLEEDIETEPVDENNNQSTEEPEREDVHNNQDEEQNVLNEGSSNRRNSDNEQVNIEPISRDLSDEEENSNEDALRYISAHEQPGGDRRIHTNARSENTEEDKIQLVGPIIVSDAWKNHVMYEAFDNAASNIGCSINHDYNDGIIHDYFDNTYTGTDYSIHVNIIIRDKESLNIPEIEIISVDKDLADAVEENEAREEEMYLQGEKFEVSILNVETGKYLTTSSLSDTESFIIAETNASGRANPISLKYFIEDTENSFYEGRYKCTINKLSNREGYKENNEPLVIEFTINSNGNIIYDETKTTGYAREIEQNLSALTIIIEDKAQEPSVIIKKTNKEGELINGVDYEFTIGELTENITTGENEIKGTTRPIYLDSLTYGETYECVLKEDGKTLPDGYETVIGNPISFELSLTKNGTIIVEDFAQNYINAVIDSKANTLTITTKSYIVSKSEIVIKSNDDILTEDSVITIKVTDKDGKEIFVPISIAKVNEDKEIIVEFDSEQTQKIIEAINKEEEEYIDISIQINKGVEGYNNEEIKLGEFKYEYDDENNEGKIVAVKDVNDEKYKIIEDSNEIIINKPIEKEISTFNLQINAIGNENQKLNGGKFEVSVVQNGKSLIDNGVVNSAELGIILSNIQIVPVDECTDNIVVTIVEKAAPTGYEFYPGEIEIEFEYKDSKWISDMETSYRYVTMNYEYNANLLNWECVNKNQSSSTNIINLVHTPIENLPEMQITLEDGATGKPLAGASFRVLNSFKTTDLDGKIKDIKLDYTLDKTVEINQTSTALNTYGNRNTEINGIKYVAITDDIKLEISYNVNAQIDVITYVNSDGESISKKIIGITELILVDEEDEKVKLLINKDENFIDVRIKNYAKPIDSAKLRIVSQDEDKNLLRDNTFNVTIDGTKIPLITNLKGSVEKNLSDFISTLDERTYSGVIGMEKINSDSNYLAKGDINFEFEIKEKDGIKQICNVKLSLKRNDVKISTVGNVLEFAITRYKEGKQNTSTLNITIVDAEDEEEKIEGIIEVRVRIDETKEIIKTGLVTENGEVEVIFDEEETMEIRKANSGGSAVIVEIIQKQIEDGYENNEEPIVIGEFIVVYNPEDNTGNLVACDDNETEEHTSDSYKKEKNSNEIIIKKKKSKVSFEISKLDSKEETALEGVEFFIRAIQRCRDEETDEITEKVLINDYFLTNGKGEIVLDEMSINNVHEGGEITLAIRENKSLDGYRINKESIIQNYRFNEENQKWEKAEGEEIENVTINNCNIKILNSLVTSSSLRMKAVDGLNGVALSEVEFTVTIGDKVYENLTTNANGYIDIDLAEFKSLTEKQEFTVTIKETKTKDGYSKIIEDKIFTMVIDENGKIAQFNKKDQELSIKLNVGKDLLECAVKKYPVNSGFTLIKADKEGNKLENAKFKIRITGATEKEDDEFETINIITDETDAEGKLNIHFNLTQTRAIAMAKIITIYATEILAPNGYVENTLETALGTFRYVYDEETKEGKIVAYSTQENSLFETKEADENIVLYNYDVPMLNLYIESLDSETREEISDLTDEENGKATYIVKVVHKNSGEILLYKENVNCQEEVLKIQGKTIKDNILVTIVEDNVPTQYSKTEKTIELEYKYNEDMNMWQQVKPTKENGYLQSEYSYNTEIGEWDKSISNGMPGLDMYSISIIKEKILSNLQIIKVDARNREVIRNDVATFDIRLESAGKKVLLENKQTDNGEIQIVLDSLMEKNTFRQGTYTVIITEKDAPAGFKETKDIIFKVEFNSYGKIIGINCDSDVELYGGKVTLTTDSSIQVVVPNEFNYEEDEEDGEIMLEIVKAAQEGITEKRLAGAIFEVYVYDRSGSELIAESDSSVLTNNNGCAIIEFSAEDSANIQRYVNTNRAVSIRVKEVQNPLGYISPVEDIINLGEFTLLENKLIASASQELTIPEENTETEDETIKIATLVEGATKLKLWNIKASKAIRLELMKIDNSSFNYPISNVEFTATYIQNDEILMIQTFRTATDGNITFEEVDPRTFDDIKITLHEKQESLTKGIEPLERDIELLFKYDETQGVWTNTSAEQENVTVSTVEENEEYTTARVEIKDYVRIEKFIIYKLDAQNREKLGESVRFKISTQGAKKVKIGENEYTEDFEYSTDENGQIVIDKMVLENGSSQITMEIEEIDAPVGYKKLDNPIKLIFTRVQNGWKLNSEESQYAGNIREFNFAEDIIIRNYEGAMAIKNIPIMNLRGTVWDDGETNNNNGIKDDGEKGIEGIEVYLINGEEIVKEDIFGNSFENMKTDKNGNYSFNNIERSNSYEIAFVYDGLKTESTYYMRNSMGTFGNEENRDEDIYIYSSKAEEIQRKEFNTRFETIMGKIEDSNVSQGGELSYGITSGEIDLTYKNSNDKAEVITTNGGIIGEPYKILAITDKYLVNTETWRETWNDQNYALSINFGLINRELDLALENNLEYARVTINDKETRYNYKGNENNQLYIYQADFDYSINNYLNELVHNGVNSEDIETLKQAINSGKISRDDELKVYVTYSIKLFNEKSTQTRINEVANYYSSYFEDIPVEIWYEKNNSALTRLSPESIVTYGNRIDVEGNSYKKLYLNTSEFADLAEGEETTIYITFKIREENGQPLPNGGNIILNNVSEITSYTSAVGMVDLDSAPANAVTQDKRFRFEDDTDKAGNLVLSIKPELTREVSGIVWDDTADSEDGKYTSGEKTIKDITAQLIEIKEIDGKKIEYIWKETKTDEGGKYKFDGYAAGEYIVRFIYGDWEKVYDATSGLTDSNIKYNGQDYQSTIDSNYQATWYKSGNYEESASVARDNEARRLAVMAYSEYMNKSKGEELKLLDKTWGELSEEERNKLKTLLVSTCVCAETSKLNVLPDFESDKIDVIDNSSTIDATSNNYKNYKLVLKRNNINFGLKQRAITKVTLEKHITSVDLRTYGIGAMPLVSARIDLDKIKRGEIIEEKSINGITENLTVLAGSRTERGYWKIETDIEELMEGAELTVVYNFIISNVSEEDYISQKLETKYENSSASEYEGILNGIAENVKNNMRDANYNSLGQYLGQYYYTGIPSEGDAKVSLRVEDIIEKINPQISFTDSKNTYFEAIDTSSNEEILKVKTYNSDMELKDSKVSIIVKNKEPSNELSFGGQDTIKSLTLSDILEASGEMTFRSYISEIEAYSIATGRRALTEVPGNLSYVNSNASEIKLETLAEAGKRAPFYNLIRDNSYYKYGSAGVETISLDETRIKELVKLNEEDEYWGETVIITKETGGNDKSILISYLEVGGLILGVAIITAVVIIRDRKRRKSK